jgi:hypothetical protein
LLLNKEFEAKPFPGIQKAFRCKTAERLFVYADRDFIRNGFVSVVNFALNPAKL